MHLTAKYKWIVGILLLLGLPLLFLAMQTPTHHGDWQPMQSRLPEVRIDNDTLHVRHLRDFRYHPDGKVKTIRYLEQSYPLAELKGVWFGISHFAERGLAHTLLSFEFADGRYLVASVEARMRPQQSYHPLPGMLHRYHKIIILGSEEDIIGLRSHIREERVLLYPLQLNEAQRQHILLGMMKDVEALHQQPAFYNTLLDNCTTSLLRHNPQYSTWRGLLDYRILLPGHSDNYAQQRGWIDPERDLRSWRREAVIPAGVSPEQAAFSQQIRRPNYPQLSLSLLVMQQDLHHGKPVQTRGVVRGFADPEHYWIEDPRMNRVALEPGERALPFLGQAVEVSGYFSFHPEQGRSLRLEQIEISP